MKNIIDTVASQYANSPTLMQLIDNMNQYFDPTTDFEEFYKNIWDIDTARGFGLDIWGRIVNVGREITLIETPTYFGFIGGDTSTTVAFLAPPTTDTGYPYLAEPTVTIGAVTTDMVGFDQAPFFNPGVDITRTYQLDDDVYRTLILAKALYNISLSTPASINQLLRNLFPNRGKCYVRDEGGMRITFVFEFLLKPHELAILEQSGAVPRPAAVKSAILQLLTPSTFGFLEADGLPFGEGVFFN